MLLANVSPDALMIFAVLPPLTTTTLIIARVTMLANTPIISLAFTLYFPFRLLVPPSSTDTPGAYPIPISRFWNASTP